MTINVTLSPDQEAFARERVESGEYASIEDVVRDGLALLKEHQDALERLEASFAEAEAEAERDGWIPLEDALAEAEAIITEAERSAANR